MALDLDSLNPEQREAVTTTEGAVLVLAGAGSGKTRVITTRIAYLMRRKGVEPGSILAMTFTNKAAREMNERVAAMVGRASQGGKEARPLIGTFHSFGVRFLRRHIDHAGYRSNFVIYDEGDQLAVVREILEQLEDSAFYTAKSALYALQRAKSEGLTPAELLARSDSPTEVLLGAIYREYQTTLKGMNAIDFEDILQLSLRVCREAPEAAARFFAHYRYVLVDEYQDTNKVQFELLRVISKPHGNLCVVGDDDQSIYGWRGADPANILQFERHFPDARVVRLEQNYRSTRTILAAANQVISRNTERRAKTLRATRHDDGALEWIEGENETDEMERVVIHLKRTRIREGDDYAHYAILYRSNHQSRAIEEQLREEGIPYLLVGGTRFYDRKEVKDAIAYLRLAHNPADEVSLFRVINFPRRGIGKTSRLKLVEGARARRLNCIDLMGEAEHHPDFGGAPGVAMARFAALIGRYRERFAAEPLAETFREMLAELDFHRAVEQEKTDQKGRDAAVGLVLEMEQAAAHFARNNPEAGLKEYLDRISLLSMPEDNEAERRTPMVRLMTVHSAKGLEFDHVYLIGMAEEVFPNHRALQEGALEEERRLAYVAITRAKRHLVFSFAKVRRRWREVIPQQPSRFALDIDPALFEGIPPAADGKAAAYKHIREKNKVEAKRRFFDQIKKLGSEENEEAGEAGA